MGEPLFLSGYPRCIVLVGVAIRLLFSFFIIFVKFIKVFEERECNTNKNPAITSGVVVHVDVDEVGGLV
jgi:hypothetical protein